MTNPIIQRTIAQFRSNPPKHKSEKILRHLLEGGSITDEEARIKFHCTSVRSRIAEWVQQGYPIARKFESNKHSGSRYKRYWMEV